LLIYQFALPLRQKVIPPGIAQTSAFGIGFFTLKADIIGGNADCRTKVIARSA
jgi:hypothetical protein